MESLAVLLVLLVAAIPFAMPIVAWVSGRRTRARVAALERVVLQQAQDLERTLARLEALEAPEQRGPAGAPAPAREAAEGSPSGPAPVQARQAPPVAPLERPERPFQPIPQLEPLPPREPLPSREPLTTIEPLPSPALTEGTGRPIEPVSLEAMVRGADTTQPLDVGKPAPPAAPPPPPPPSPAAASPSGASFDWESLIGVKLFAAIAGIALVVAAVSFLKYSIDEGWLQPPVRVAIGVIVAIVLLVLCELKSAREYPATANALDGAAIAILFATFFSAHALWNLIPAFTTFLLLGIVTALAVLLSVRRESLFIAVLGLMGGFATPALLSSGDNRPVPLFAYLLLLNIGLAWVAYRQTWPVLTWLTLGFTTLYQWIWVIRFLAESSVPLAMGIFLVFPLAAAVALVLGGPRPGEPGAPGQQFERTAMLSAGVPLLFAGYLASVPAYGAQASLLLGFLLLVDAGLLAIAIARRQPLLHAVAGLATLVVLAVWLSTSYVPGAGWQAALAFTAAFVVLFLAAAPAARWLGRPFDGSASRLAPLAPLLLFVFPALAAVEPVFVRPFALFATLLVVLLAVAWRAIAEPNGRLFYVASFFAVATQAIWSAQYLTEARLRPAVLIYTVFGLVSIAAPVLARRAGRPLQPAWGSGAVLIASLVLLVFVSLGPVSPAALWALALLLAIMNAGLFVESASGGLPRVSHVGTLLSWALLGIWWLHSAGSVGVLASLSVMTGLTLVTLAGHAWGSRRGARDDAAPGEAATFHQGLYLALVGHLFLMVIASNREWSLPPWPIFGALAVMTLGTSAVSLLTRTPALHAAGVVGAALVVASWAGAAGTPAWGLTVVLASAAVSAFALSWTRVANGLSVKAAAVVLFVGEMAVLSASQAGARPPFAAELAIHVLNIALILALTTRQRWRLVPVAAVVPAWAAVLQWQQMPEPAGTWGRLLLLAGALYAVFAAYPLALGARARDNRDPYVAAILASAMFFLAGRHGMEAAGLGWAVGVVPVGVAAVLAVLLRSLLALEPEGQRDLGRLALVAGASLAFITVAIPLQLQHQWITIGWALEGAAMAWLFTRIPHRGLFYFATALLAAVFVRLTLNPEILLYEPRGMRIFNWYLYAYLICAAAMFAAAWWMSGTRDQLVPRLPRTSALLAAGAVIVLFLLLNIEIADYYSTGPTIAFSFGSGVSQDLTYTIGWLVFGMLLLAAGIYAGNRPARITAVALIAVTTVKCFLYDLASLGGLYRVGSFVGLALSLALVSMALKKYVLSQPKGRT